MSNYIPSNRLNLKSQCLGYNLISNTWQSDWPLLPKHTSSRSAFESILPNLTYPRSFFKCALGKKKALVASPQSQTLGTLGNFKHSQSTPMCKQNLTSWAIFSFFIASGAKGKAPQLLARIYRHIKTLFHFICSHSINHFTHFC